MKVCLFWHLVTCLVVRMTIHYYGVVPEWCISLSVSDVVSGRHNASNDGIGTKLLRLPFFWCNRAIKFHISRNWKHTKPSQVVVSQVLKYFHLQGKSRKRTSFIDQDRGGQKSCYLLRPSPIVFRDVQFASSWARGLGKPSHASQIPSR